MRVRTSSTGHTSSGFVSLLMPPVFVCALISLSAATAAAQSETAKPASGVQIVKLKWDKQARLPRNFDPSVIPDNGVFTTMESRTTVPGSSQAPYGDDIRRDAANRSAALDPADYFPKSPSRMPFSYVYSLTMRNAGTRTIQAVAWDYLFISATSAAVVGNHHIFNYRVTKPGETVILRGFQRTRPISVVTAGGNTDDKKVTKNIERAVIQCVLYQDGTSWQNPGRDGACDSLRANKPAPRKANDAQSRGK